MGPLERTLRESCVICLKAFPRKDLTKLSTCDNNGVTSLDKIETLTGLQDLNGFDKYSFICGFCKKDLFTAYAFHNQLLTAYDYWNSDRSDKQGEDGEELVHEPEVNLILTDCDYVKKKNLECDDTSTSPFFCINCKGTFITSSDMLNHICDTAKKRKDCTTKNKTTYVCSYCNKSFKRSNLLSEHLSIHTGVKNFCCKLCDKTFQCGSSVSRHMKTHQQPPGQKSKKSPFLCNICGKRFPYTNGLQRHMRIHNGVKPHECQFCGNKFRQSTHLQVHLRTHTREKPYVCEACGDSFSLNATLQKHMNSKHKRHSRTVSKLEGEILESPNENISGF